SEETSQYPCPSGATTRLTTPAVTLPAPEPWNTASPKANTPPSAATNQYPRPDGAAAMPTTAWFSSRPPKDPANTASPKANTPPSDAATHAPCPVAVAAAPTMAVLDTSCVPGQPGPVPNESAWITVRSSLGGAPQSDTNR